MRDIACNICRRGIGRIPGEGRAFRKICRRLPPAIHHESVGTLTTKTIRRVLEHEIYFGASYIMSRQSNEENPYCRAAALFLNPKIKQGHGCVHE